MNFKQIRIELLEKRNYKCEVCDSGESRIPFDKGGSKSSLCVHHKDGDVENNSIHNLMVVCIACHGKENVKMRKRFPLTVSLKNGFEKILILRNYDSIPHEKMVKIAKRAIRKRYGRYQDYFRTLKRGDC